MLIKNIFTSENFDSHEKLCNKVKRNQEPLTDVTLEKFSRGDLSLTICGHTYNAKEFDTVVKGFTAKLYQTSTGELVIVNIKPEVDFHILTPEVIDDYNVVFGFQFQPFTDYDDSLFKSRVLSQYLMKEETKLAKTEKVVGTSFRTHRDIDEFFGDKIVVENVPTKKGVALLLPEPTNPYDPNAVMVVTKMVDGSQHHLGYLAKGSELQQTIKQPTVAELKIMAYSDAGDYNDSYTVTVQG